MLQQKELTCEMPGFEARVTVATATAAMGLYRSQLIDQGMRAEEENPVLHTFLWLHWPVIKAGTLDGFVAWEVPDPDTKPGEDGEQPVMWNSVPIQHLEFYEFLNNVPEEFATDWLAEILDLNPHWVHQSREAREADAQDPKKKRKRRASKTG